MGIKLPFKIRDDLKIVENSFIIVRKNIDDMKFGGTCLFLIAPFVIHFYGKIEKVMNRWKAKF